MRLNRQNSRDTPTPIAFAVVLVETQITAAHAEPVIAQKKAKICNGFSYTTKFVKLEEITADEEISRRNFVKLATNYLTCVRYIDGKSLIFDKNYFLVKFAQGLNEEIAKSSIYD